MRSLRKTLFPFVAAGALVGLTALAPAPAAVAAGSSSTTAKVIRVIDGDTVVTTKGTVRIIGIDTPERGRCGAAAATAKLRPSAWPRLAPRCG